MGDLSPEMKALPKEERFRLCNLGVGQIANRPRKTHKSLGERGGLTCAMYMSELPYLPSAINSYSVTRNPRHHVLSQFFHCSESKDGGPVNRRKARIAKNLTGFPTLDEYLGYWVENINRTKPTHVGLVSGYNNSFCYDPVSMQSRYAGYNPENKSQLQERYAVIGPMDQLDTVICVVFIHYTGWVPTCCVCNNNETTGQGNTTKNDTIPSHGVTHHGSSYNTTQEQDEMINKLVEKDWILYEHSKVLFQQQVKIIEQEFGITLCEQIKRGGDWPFILDKI